MKKNYRSLIEVFVSNNFWGILLGMLFFLSVLLISVLGIGVFLLSILMGFIGFVIGNARDKGISPIENVKFILDKLNEKIKKVKR